MKKVFFVIILTLTLFNSCVYDRVVCMSIINRTNDTILICYARYNNMDSVEYYIGNLEPFQLKFDEAGKIILHEKIISHDSIWGIEYCSSDIIFPDSCGRHCQPWSFFDFNEDKKGYFFIIKLETAQNYTWDEIRKNELYEKMIVTREMLKKNNRKINYSP